MEIKLGHGIDTIQFGLTETQAVSALGVPDKVFSPIQKISDCSLTSF